MLGWLLAPSICLPTSAPKPHSDFQTNSPFVMTTLLGRVPLHKPLTWPGAYHDLLLSGHFLRIFTFSLRQTLITEVLCTEKGLWGHSSVWRWLFSGHGSRNEELVSSFNFISLCSIGLCVTIYCSYYTGLYLKEMGMHISILILHFAYNMVFVKE
jgi:hypothetical protein